jgi:hypothetical protein
MPLLVGHYLWVAARLVEDGDSIALDASTTAFQIARHLKARRELTVVINVPQFPTSEKASHRTAPPPISTVMLGWLLQPCRRLLGSCTSRSQHAGRLQGPPPSTPTTPSISYPPSATCCRRLSLGCRTFRRLTSVGSKRLDSWERPSMTAE